MRHVKTTIIFLGLCLTAIQALGRVGAEEVSYTFQFNKNVVGPNADASGYEAKGGNMPDIIQLEDGTWRMYYGAAVNPPQNGVSNGIKYADSSDGLNWTVKSGYCLLAANGTGSDGVPLNEGVIRGPRVVRLSNGTYYMYYQAQTVGLNPSDFRVKLASSEDGVTFTRVGTVVEINYPNGGAGQFSLAAHCAVIRFSDTDFRIFVSGNYNGKTAGNPSDLVMGESADGKTFDNWQILYIGGHDPAIIKTASGGYRMFFGRLLERQRTAYSADGKTWPTADKTTATVILRANGTEITEADEPEMPADRAALELPSGEILLFEPWGLSDPNIVLMRQKSPWLTGATSQSVAVAAELSYEITAGGEEPFTYSASSLPTGLSLSGKTIVGSVATAGIYSIGLRVQNAFGFDEKTLRLAVGNAPNITCSLTKSATVGVPFSHTLTADGDGTIAYTATSLPDGLTLSGSVISGTPTAAGAYAVTLAASSDWGTDQKTLTITVSELSNTTDADGDGVCDLMEMAFGSDPSDPSSFPADSIDKDNLSVSKAQMKLDFSGKENKDRISIQGVLPASEDTVFAGQLVTAYIGGILVEFDELSAKGASPAGNQTVKIGIKPKNGTVKFMLKLNKGAYADELADENLTGEADIKAAEGKTANVELAIVFNDVLYVKTMTLKYVAKKNKQGTAKM